MKRATRTVEDNRKSGHKNTRLTKSVPGLQSGEPICLLRLLFILLTFKACLDYMSCRADFVMYDFVMHDFSVHTGISNLV